MYGSTSSCSSVHYSVSQRSPGSEIQFLATISNMEKYEERSIITTTNATSRRPRKSIQETVVPTPNKITTPFQFQSQIRAKKVEERVSETKKFFQLYKLRGYLSFLENLQPKVEDTCLKLSEFCEEAEEAIGEITEEELSSFSTDVERELDDMEVEMRDFKDTRTKLNGHLHSLHEELGSIEDLMRRIFILQYSSAEYAQLEEAIQNLYTPASLTDPPNFERCLEFIHGSLVDIRMRILGFKALVRTMENCGKLSQFNSEIIRLVFHIKEFQVLANETDFGDLWGLLPSKVKLILSGRDIRISTWTEEENARSYLQASDELEGLVRLSTSADADGDDSVWAFKCVEETKGHYFTVENKKTGSLLGLRREGPEYRQVHHRPLQLGYFNQQWQLLVDSNDRIIMKNRAHYDLVLTSNGQSNVQACLLLHEQLQYWCIECCDSSWE